jgi:hypothetical protein
VGIPASQEEKRKEEKRKEEKRKEEKRRQCLGSDKDFGFSD